MDGTFGIATLCVGGGQGMALLSGASVLRGTRSSGSATRHLAARALFVSIAVDAVFSGTCR